MVLADTNTFTLARELLSEKQYPLAAVEFRRFALETDEPAHQAAAYLYAGYAYLQNRQSESCSEMLDRAESSDTDSRYASESELLNAENAYRSRDADTALYFYDALVQNTESTDSRTFALRRAAAIHLTEGDFTAARQQLSLLPESDPAALQSVETYENGRDKSPVVGGLLGLIPGAGYWYSGEIANGFRSLLLNSLFIYGMVDTAQQDQWGGFAVITFFEITWYSGSVYGGIDSAQRYNKDRLDTAIQGIERDMSYQPDPGITIPIFKLNFEF